MKKRYKLKKKPKIILIIIILLIIAIIISFLAIKHINLIQNTIREEKPVKKEIKYVLDSIEEKEEKIEESQDANIEENESYEEITRTNESYTTRMTSYYPEEGETMTASGLGIYDFGVNDKGWFTYNGKLVVATASTRLGYTEMRTYNLYDELTINIDGIDYQAIVLDVCGACQRDNRIDLFASSIVYAKDTIIEVYIK